MKHTSKIFGKSGAINLTKTSEIIAVKKVDAFSNEEIVKFTMTQNGKFQWSVSIKAELEEAFEMIEKLVENAKNLKELREDLLDIVKRMKNELDLDKMEFEIKGL